MNVTVVGGSSGLGYELARTLKEEGHNVAALSRRGTGPCICINDQYDIRWGEFHEAMYHSDTIILSAGMGAFLGPHQVNAETIDTLIATNLRGPLLLANRIITRWRHKHENGKLIFVTSTAGDSSAHGLGIYAACKKGLEGFVRAEGPHAHQKGIELLAFSLGWFESPMTAQLDPRIRHAAEQHCPNKRFATLDETVNWCRAAIDRGTGVYRFWAERVP